MALLFLRAVLAFYLVMVSSALELSFPSHVRALHDIKAAVGQQDPLWSNWTGFDPCNSGWIGVTCQEGAIIKLALDAMNLKGQLPPAIGDLVNLQSLDLSFNRELTGAIPHTLANLTSLVELKLQQCDFTGAIPEELGFLVNLEHLQLAGNRLTGPIPSSISPLTKLKWFDIGGNQISGRIPTELGNLVSIQHIHLWNNSLEGPVPASLGQLPAVIHLLLDNNQLGGVLPPELGNMSSLKILRLSHNKNIQGEIPPSYANLTSLTQLELKDVGLTGKMPDLSKMLNLEVLDVSFNNLIGQISPVLGNGLDKLVLIDLSDNAFSGSISSYLGSLERLAYLDLSSNSFMGDIPDTIGGESQPNIQLMDFSNNKLTGAGSELSFMKPPATVLFAGNPLCSEGDIPVCKNQRPPTGEVAQDVCQVFCGANSYPNPAIFKAASVCTCSSPLTVVLKLFATSFPADEFDAKLAASMAATISNAYQNGSMKLDITQVQPLAWQEVGSTQVNVSFRFYPPQGSYHFDFDMGKDMIDRFSRGKFPFDQPEPLGIGPYVVLEVIRPNREPARGRPMLKTWEIAVIVIASVLLTIGIAALVLYALVQKKRADTATLKAKAAAAEYSSFTAASSYDPNAPRLKGAQFYSMAELREATNNFNEERVLGSGGYGKVYRGQLPSGVEIAVKRASEDSLQGATEFKVEIEILSQVYHKNLIRLLGFCTEAGAEILVYEFMPQGNLRDAIFCKGTAREPLPFSRRLAIATGAARGIAYLHHDVSPPIIHRDIKPTNILLDKNWEPKVADFGLCKEYTNTMSMQKTAIKGTLGYMDPEYQMSMRLTEKSDVYSFGVALLELFTAIPAIQRGKTMTKHITQQVQEKLCLGGAPAVVDPALGPDYNLDVLARVIAIALQCTASHDARPNMGTIVKGLEDIQKALWKTADGGSMGAVLEIDSIGGTSITSGGDHFPSDDMQMGNFGPNSGQTSFDPRFDMNNSSFYYSGNASALHHGR